MKKLHKKSSVVTTLLLVALGLFCGPGVAHSQVCPRLWEQGQPIQGTNGQVVTSIMWDPDGSGPRPPLVVLGGTFTVAGTVQANNIAAYDPSTRQWTALGAGLTKPISTPQVTALAVLPDGRLLAGGSFSRSGASTLNNIAVWNGQAWSALGSGTNSNVMALLTLNTGEVIACGGFTQAGGVSANHIASWNGTAWSPLGSGISGLSVFALAQTQQGVFAGGSFTSAGGVPAISIARWDGAEWHAVGNGLGADVLGLATTTAGDVYAVGRFTTLTGAPTPGIARWDGATWQAVGQGLTTPPRFVRVLSNGQVLLGADYLKVWSGSGFSSLVTVVGNFFTAVEHSPGNLITGGIFENIGESTHNVARYENGEWGPLTQTLDGSVLALARRPFNPISGEGGELYVGGGFQNIDGVMANRIARRVGSTWSALGDGLNNGVNSIAFAANGDVIVGGSFTMAGGEPANHIARWDGSAWHPIGTGMEDYVQYVAVRPNGDILATGGFRSAGGVFADGMARWDGTRWLSMGYESGSGAANKPIAVAGNGDVFVNGSRRFLTGESSAGILRWDGTNWSTFGPALSSANAILVLPNGDLVVAGNMAGKVVRSSGGTWSSLGGGADLSVSDLSLLGDGRIVAVGSFSNVGSGASVAAKSIAIWDGAAWTPIGTGLSAPALAVDAVTTPTQIEIDVGGTFVTAGGLPSQGLARAVLAIPPNVNVGPRSVAICGGQAAAFTVNAGGTPPITYEWLFNGTPISVSGNPSATTPSLMIASASPGDVGTYSCRISNACANIQSPGATLTFVCCADFDHIGGLTVFDIFAYLNAWFTGSPDADMNGDGLTVGDLLDFLNAWVIGC